VFLELHASYRPYASCEVGGLRDVDPAASFRLPAHDTRLTSHALRLDDRAGCLSLGEDQWVEVQTTLSMPATDSAPGGSVVKCRATATIRVSWVSWADYAVHRGLATGLAGEAAALAPLSDPLSGSFCRVLKLGVCEALGVLPARLLQAAGLQPLPSSLVPRRKIVLSLKNVSLAPVWDQDSKADAVLSDSASIFGPGTPSGTAETGESVSLSVLVASPFEQVFLSAVELDTLGHAPPKVLATGLVSPLPYHTLPTHGTRSAMPRPKSSQRDS